MVGHEVYVRLLHSTTPSNLPVWAEGEEVQVVTVVVEG